MRIPRVRELRESAGLTQGELAERAGISLGTVGRVEQGNNTNPPTARKIAAALDCKPSDLQAIAR